MRWWDLQDNLLLTGFERLALTEVQLHKERQRADTLAQKLLELGIDPLN